MKIRMEKNEKAYLPILSSRFLSFAVLEKKESACSLSTSGLTPEEAVLRMEGLDGLEGFDLFFVMQRIPENRKESFRKAAIEPGVSK